MLTLTDRYGCHAVLAECRVIIMQHYHDVIDNQRIKRHNLFVYIATKLQTCYSQIRF